MKHSEKILALCLDSNMFDDQEDPLSRLIDRYKPLSEELLEDDLLLVSAAQKQLSYQDFLERTREK